MSGMTDVNRECVADFEHGRKSSIGTSAVALTALTFPTKKGVYLKAPASNTADVYIGKNDVTTDSADASDGFPLSPGDPPIFIEVQDLTTLFARAASGTQKLFFLAF